jgi:rubredoxin
MVKRRPSKWATCPNCGGQANEFAEVHWPTRSGDLRRDLRGLFVTIRWRCPQCGAEWEQTNSSIRYRKWRLPGSVRIP